MRLAIRRSLAVAMAFGAAVAGGALPARVASAASSATASDLCWYKVTSSRAPIRDNPDTNSQILGYYYKDNYFASSCAWHYDVESGHWFVQTIYDGDNDPDSWVDYYHIN